MRWQLTTKSGRAFGSAKTTKERDALCFSHLGKYAYSDDVTVFATDTRTGRVIELSRPLKRKTITKAAR